MNSFILTLVLLPLLTFLLISLLEHRFSINAYGLFNICIFIVTAMALALLFMLFFVQDSNYKVEVNWNWLTINQLNLQFKLILTNLSIVVLFIVTLITSIVQLYMKNDHTSDKNHHKILALILFSTFMIILTDNILIISVFWFLISFGSFFSYLNLNRLSSQNKDVNNFIIPFTGDILFLVATLIIYSQTTTFDLSVINETLRSTKNAPFAAPAWSILIMISVILKGAHFPFHFWFRTALKGRLVKSAIIQILAIILVPLYILIRLYPIILSAVLVFWAYYIGLAMLLYFTIASIHKRVKAIIQFSLLGHSGLIILGLSTFSNQAIINYLICFMLFSILLCLLLDFLFEHGLRHKSQKEYKDVTLSQLVKNTDWSPFLSWMFLWLTLLVVGIPLTATFIAKIDLYTSIFQVTTNKAQLWGPLIFALIANILIAFYIARVSLVLIYPPGRKTNTKPRSGFGLSHHHYLALVILSFLGLYLFYTYPHFNPLASKTWLNLLVQFPLSKTRLPLNTSTLNLVYILILVLSITGLCGAWFVVIKNRQFPYFLKIRFNDLYNLLLRGIIPENYFSKFIVLPIKSVVLRTKDLEEKIMGGFPHRGMEIIVKKILYLNNKICIRINKILACNSRSPSRPIQYLRNSNLLIVSLIYLLIIIIGLIVVLI